MRPIPLVRVNTLLPLVAFLQEMGAPVQRLMKVAKLPLAVCDQPEGLIPLHQACYFLERAARSQGILLFGLHTGRRVRPEDLGAFGRLISASLTLYEAITITSRLVAAQNTGARIWLNVRDGQAQLCHQFVAGIERGRQQADHYTVILLLQVIRLSAGANWRPREVHFETGPVPGLDQIEPLAGAELSFNQEATALFFPESLLSLPMEKRIELPVARSDMETALRASAPAGDLIGSVRQVLGLLLRENYPDIGLAAEVAGVSIRTFQRWLAASNLTYSRLVEQVRFEKAMQLLAEPRCPLLDIAFELGYTEPANFSRAFRRWTGVSPLQFRRQRALG
ncbi:MAG: AraC family transcriptional regulator ligand-binding domain-containing protein [Candidatus Competibacteraceae bacterium]